VSERGDGYQSLEFDRELDPLALLAH